MSIRSKVSIKLVFTFIIVAVMSVFLQTLLLSDSISKITSDDALDYLTLLSTNYANDTNEFFHDGLDLATQINTTLKVLYEEGKIRNVPADRQIALSFLKATHDNNLWTSAVWTAWDVNAFDGQDAIFVNKPGHSETGRLTVSSYTIDGVNTLTPLLYFEQPEVGNYYLIPFKTQRESILEPYEYLFPTGETHLLTSMSVPIRLNDKVVGVSGVDVDIAYFVQQMSSIRPMDVGEIMLISPSLLIVGHSNTDFVGKDLITTPYNVFNSAISDALSSGKPVIKIINKGWIDGLGDAAVAIIPFSAGTTSPNWAVATIVPVDRLMATTAILMDSSLKTVFVALALAVIIGLLAVKIVPSYIQDLKEFKTAQSELDLALEDKMISDDRIKIMFNTLPMVCSFWDANRTILETNQAAATLFDLPDKQIYQDNFLKLSPEFQSSGSSTQEMFKKKIAQVFEQGHSTFEWMHQKLDGTPIPCEVTIIKVPYGNEFTAVSYTRDLRELRATQAELNVAEQRSIAKSTFLANMSHEIRTPLNAILGLLYLINQNEVTQTQHEYLDKIESAAKTLLHVINDILDFSKIEAGKLEMENTPFFLTEVLKNVTNLFSSQVHQKGLELILIISPDTPAGLIGDQMRLLQILSNLISNAVKFTEIGKITLNVEAESKNQEQVTLRFSIHDTGLGLTNEQISHLFSAFTQADTSTTRRFGGTGLGLAICKRLVAMMGGTIKVDSKYGCGSTFIFTAKFAFHSTQLVSQSPIYLREPEKSNLFNGVEPQKKQDKLLVRDFIGARILLAEDNEVNQLVASRILKSAGLIVDIADNGLQALEMAKTGKYQLILMDIQMPVMDGLTATRKIRTIDQLNDVPILAMTANAMIGDREMSLKAGMDDHISKPININELFTALAKWLKKNAR